MISLCLQEKQQSGFHVKVVDKAEKMYYYNQKKNNCSQNKSLVVPLGYQNVILEYG